MCVIEAACDGLQEELAFCREFVEVVGYPVINSTVGQFGMSVMVA